MEESPKGAPDMLTKTGTAAILLLLISAATIACGTSPDTEPETRTTAPTTTAPTTAATTTAVPPGLSPVLATTPQPGDDNNEIRLVKRDIAATREASGATMAPFPTNTPEHPPGQEGTGLKIHPNNSHEPFDPVNGPTGTEEQLVAEIDFVIQVHLDHLFKTPPDHEANRLLQGRLSEDFRRACKPREMWGALANEYRNVHHAEGRDNHNVEDLPEKITHSVEILEFDGHTATARLQFHSGENTYDQYGPAPMDHWIYVEGTPGEANRWAMEPKDIATRRQC